MTEALVPHTTETGARGAPAHASAGWFRRALESDIFYSFRRSG